jgi:thymidylate synthase
MNNLDKNYQELLTDILENGHKKETRSGEVLSVFSREIRHNMKEGFPLLTTKKMYFKGVVSELLWFLQGRTDLRYLLDNGCNIWNGDCYQGYMKKWKEYPSKGDFQPNEYHSPTEYEAIGFTQEQFIDRIKSDDEFNHKWGDLGPIYGKQWRQWQGWMDMEDVGPYAKGSLWYDQILRLIHTLKTDPDNRRMIVNAWNVAELGEMTLPPCHFGFQVYTRELSESERIELAGGRIQSKYPALIAQQIKSCDDRNIPKRAISLKWFQRSVDVPLGLPFNIASYALLLEILGQIVNMVPEELVGSLTDCHIYTNQIDGVKEQLTRDSYELPKLSMSPLVLANLQHNGLDSMLKNCTPEQFTIEGYESHPPIKIPLSN